MLLLIAIRAADIFGGVPNNNITIFNRMTLSSALIANNVDLGGGACLCEMSLLLANVAGLLKMINN